MPNRAASYFHLHLISDSTGETLTTMAKAAAVQYSQVRPIEHVHPLVRTAKQLEKVLDQVATRLAAPPLLKNTLKLLADRGRMALLPELAAAFNGLAQTATGQVEAEVTTAAPMPDKYYLELQKVLEKVTGKKVVVVRKQDPSIIAGVITRVGDKVFDGSVRNRLTELKEQLLAQ